MSTCEVMPSWNSDTLPSAVAQPEIGSRSDQDRALTLVVSKAGLPEDTGGASKVGSALHAGTIHSTVDFIPARFCQIWAPDLLTSASLPKFISPNRAFRPAF